MNLFICWSGRRGKSVAEQMAAWLQSVFGDRVVPKVSVGIDKGVAWRDELMAFVSESAAGLLCITREALGSPWVNYEAGMLSRSLGPAGASAASGAGRIYTLLLGVSASELSGPLAAFQSSDASDERDVRRLVDSLGRTLAPTGTHGSVSVDDRWRKLAEELRNRLAVVPAATLLETWPQFEDLFRRKTFEEPTQDCVSQQWLERYVGARDTLKAIRQYRPAVERACRGYTVELYRELEAALDSFAMAVSLLVGSQRFALDDDGSVRIEPPGVARACETRRSRIRQLVARLVDPGQAALFNDAVPFERAEEFAEKKNLIHRQTRAVQALADIVGDGQLPDRWPGDAFCFGLVSVSQAANLRPPESLGGRQVDLDASWRTSDWDFDRIMYALFLESRLQKSSQNCRLAQIAVDFAEAELEKVRAREPHPGSENPRHAAIVTLHYALGPLEAVGSADGPHANRIAQLAANVVAFLNGRKTVDEPVRTAAERLLARFRAARSAAPAQPDGALRAVP